MLVILKTALGIVSSFVFVLRLDEASGFKSGI